MKTTRSDMRFLSLCAVDTGHPADPHRAASTAVFREPVSPSSCFRRSLSPRLSGATDRGCRCVRPSLRSPGRMPLGAGVSRQGEALKRSSCMAETLGGSPPATSRPVDASLLASRIPNSGRFRSRYALPVCGSVSGASALRFASKCVASPSKSPASRFVQDVPAATRVGGLQPVSRGRTRGYGSAFAGLPLGS